MTDKITQELIQQVMNDDNSTYGFLNEHLDLNVIFNSDEPLTADEFQEAVSDYINESVDVIYYATAMDFLRMNDPSLRESLEKAHEYGFTADKINSELLATILLQDYCHSELCELVNELESLESEE